MSVPTPIVRSGRLGPGEMILLDLEQKQVLEGEALDRYFDELTTYTTLIDDIPLEPAQEPVAVLSENEITRLQRGFGYTREDLKMVVAPMALEGKEATWSMGDDTPIAPLARTPRPLYGFFRQRFAQVTNPAIDSLRESCVVSLRTRLGPWPHLLDKHAPLPGLVLPSPFLSLGQMAALHQDVYPMHEDLPLSALDCTFAQDDSLQNAIDCLRDRAVELVREGARILVLTDRSASPRNIAHSDGDGHRRRPSCAGRSWIAHQGRLGAGGWRLPRCPSRCRAHRIRRGRGLSVADAADRSQPGW